LLSLRRDRALSTPGGSGGASNDAVDGDGNYETDEDGDEVMN
jgi:hypothetical protein